MADLESLLKGIRDRGWAVSIQCGAFDGDGNIEGPSDTFDAFVFVPRPSVHWEHSDDDAIKPEHLDWEVDPAEVFEGSSADSPEAALTAALESAERWWDVEVEDAAALRRDNYDSAIAGATGAHETAHPNDVPEEG